MYNPLEVNVYYSSVDPILEFGFSSSQQIIFCLHRVRLVDI